jgi:hypothetical protein
MGWNKAGIWIAHAGLILLLVGELVSGLVQRDYQMRLDEGETKNYSESSRLNELAIIDATDPISTRWWRFRSPFWPMGPSSRTRSCRSAWCRGSTMRTPTIQMRSQAPNAPPSLATVGMGTMVAVTPLDVTYKEDERNLSRRRSWS